MHEARRRLLSKAARAACGHWRAVVAQTPQSSIFNRCVVEMHSRMPALSSTRVMGRPAPHEKRGNPCKCGEPGSGARVTAMACRIPSSSRAQIRSWVCRPGMVISERRPEAAPRTSNDGALAVGVCRELLPKAFPCRSGSAGSLTARPARRSVGQVRPGFDPAGELRRRRSREPTSPPETSKS